MTDDGRHDRAARLVGMYRAKADEEVRAALATIGTPSAAVAGDPLARVVLVKGVAGPAEASGGPLMSGPDGAAATAALSALGFDPPTWFAVMSRAGLAGDDAGLRNRWLLEAIEVADPYAVVALDPVAAEDLAAALGIRGLTPSDPVSVAGRTVIALEGLERSLDDPALKRRVWRQLKALAPRGPVW